MASADQTMPKALVEWDDVPRRFVRLSTAVFNLPASHWERFGARFASNDDGEYALDVATGTAVTPLGPIRFSILDEDETTTLEVSNVGQHLHLRSHAVILALSASEMVDLDQDLLQDDVGLEPSAAETPTLTPIESLSELRSPQAGRPRTRAVADFFRSAADFVESLTFSRGSGEQRTRITPVEDVDFAAALRSHYDVTSERTDVRLFVVSDAAGHDYLATLRHRSLRPIVAKGDFGVQGPFGDSQPGQPAIADLRERGRSPE